MDRSLKQPLWDECLKGAMCKVANDDEKNIDDYFQCGLIDSDKHGAFKFGSAMLQPIQLMHVPSHKPKYSYGLFLKNNDYACYITTDSVFDYQASKLFYNNADIIFQDCETTPYRSNVHAHYDDLKQLPSEIKKKMWLCHYMPDAHDKYNPTNDGFLGFVDKGQTFVI